jgi:hypothetical protein
MLIPEATIADTPNNIPDSPFSITPDVQRYKRDKNKMIKKAPRYILTLFIKIS